MLIFIESIIIGALAGFGVGAGAARMFHAPEVQAAGAFRTMGEMNACLGDPISHFSFGFSFYLNSAAQNLAAGIMDQDFLHRTIPNVAAGILTLRNKNVEETVYNPFKMAVVGAVVGAVLYPIINLSAQLVPSYVSGTMTTIFGPAVSNMLIVMECLYLIAALDNGKYTGIAGIILGAVSRLVSGNATPGLILGILTGKTIEMNGIKSNISKVFIVIMVVIWGLIAHFRGFFPKLIAAFAALHIGG
ncbi:MAG: DUF4311 domain-containing protein [Erysipelotrichaceae bacterium]|nr:DUF4311 domain-containing protein [Erysipelotrichaceae bacterium]